MGEGRRVVSWTSSARDSFDEILTFIASDSPDAASKVLEVMLAAAESLSLFAERGRIVPESTLREIFVYRYRLIYQVSASEVRILANRSRRHGFRGLAGSCSMRCLGTQTRLFAIRLATWTSRSIFVEFPGIFAVATGDRGHVPGVVPANGAPDGPEEMFVWI